MSDAPDIVERLHDEADQCRQDSADDIARLLVSAAGEILKLRAAIAQPAPQAAPTVPEGWVMVPVEPTPEMVTAGQHVREERGWSAAHLIYRAMIAAAPQEPQR